MSRLRPLLFAAASWLAPALALAEEAAHQAHDGWDIPKLAASFVNFALLVTILVWLGKDKVSDFLRGRREGLATSIEKAQRVKAEAEKKYAEYNERLKQLDAELERLKQEMIAAGQAERDRIVAEAEQKAARMRKEAQFLVEQQAKQLRQDLIAETVQAAVAHAEQLLTKATTPHDQQRLAQEYLSQLQRVASDGAGAGEANA